MRLPVPAYSCGGNACLWRGVPDHGKRSFLVNDVCSLMRLMCLDECVDRCCNSCDCLRHVMREQHAGAQNVTLLSTPL